MNTPDLPIFPFYINSLAYLDFSGGHAWHGGFLRHMTRISWSKNDMDGTRPNHPLRPLGSRGSRMKSVPALDPLRPGLRGACHVTRRAPVRRRGERGLGGLRHADGLSPCGSDHLQCATKCDQGDHEWICQVSHLSSPRPLNRAARLNVERTLRPQRGGFL